MKEISKEGIGLRIAKIRRSHHLTQEALAERLGVSAKHISHVERGCASLSIKGMMELCDFFDCSLDYLVFGKNSDKTLDLLPKPILDILYSGQEDEISRLKRYLEIYAELSVPSNGKEL